MIAPRPHPPVLGSVRSRFDAALVATRASGVTVVVNVMTCCRSCATYADMGLSRDAKGTPIAWHFGGQGRELAWPDDDHPVYLEEERECYCDSLAADDGRCDVCRYGTAERPSGAAESLIFQFEPDESVASRVCGAFRGRGFAVDWNGSMARAVTVRLV